MSDQIDGINYITVKIGEELARKFVGETRDYETSAITQVRAVIEMALPLDIEWSEDLGDIGQWVGTLREFDHVTCRAMILRLTTQTYCVYGTHNNGDWARLCSGTYSNFATLNQAKDVAERWLRNS